MGRAWLAVALGCVAVPAAAQPAKPPRPLVAPELSIRPQAALAAFTGEGVGVTVGWRPVTEATRYRFTLTDAQNQATSLETAELRVERTGLSPGRYQLTVAAIDASGTVGPASEPLPLNVIEVRAIPPGAESPEPPTRGAYPIGTRFSVPGMHCELNDAPIDDLLVGPENEVRMPIAGLVTLRCAGVPGYLEKSIVIAPVSVAVQEAKVQRGRTTMVTVTIASVAHLGERVDIEALGDIGLGEAQRTEFGFEVPVTVNADAKTATLSIQSASFELGRVPLEVIDAPTAAPPPATEPAPIEWRAVDLGGLAGLFLPPDGTAIGRPSNVTDEITGGPLVGMRVGLFPTRRVGIEAELALVAAGYADQSAVATMLASRVQLAVRAFDSGRVGLRLLVGTGVFTTLHNHGSSQATTQGEVHGGVAFTVETAPNLWLRFQIADEVTTARDDGYAHCVELQLGVVTRLGRRDAW